ncbi:hypothetical protein [Streptomyces sp. ERV7]
MRTLLDELPPAARAAVEADLSQVPPGDTLVRTGPPHTYEGGGPL